MVTYCQSFPAALILIKNETIKILHNNSKIVETSLKSPRIKILGITLDFREEFKIQLRKQNFISTIEVGAINK